MSGPRSERGQVSRGSTPLRAASAPLSLDDLRVHPGPPLADADLPRAAVVILNHNGRRHFEGCFGSLAALDYPRERLEVWLVDNGSSDGSLAELRTRHPWVRLHANPSNLGFAPACNQGASLAAGAEVLVFLNNDMRVEPSWLRELVGPIVRGEAQATTAKMYSWDGKRIDSAGGGMNFHGIGIQHGYKEEPSPEHDLPRRTLFACGGAMAVGADVFAAAGGFDPEYFAYYEDVDLGWRLWVLGHEVHYAPAAVCYHHHSSTSRTFPSETVRLLQVRNPLLSCVKNYDDENLRAVLPAALGLFLRRMLLVSGLGDPRPFRIEHARGEPRGPLARLVAALRGGSSRALREARVPITRIAAADLIGANDLLGRWEHWMARRAEVQSRRRRPDAEIFRLFLNPLWCIEDEPAYRELHSGLARFTGLEQIFEGLSVPGGEPHR